MDLKAKPVLVTGATGYMGGRLVPQLLEAGYRRKKRKKNRELKRLHYCGH